MSTGRLLYIQDLRSKYDIGHTKTRNLNQIDSVVFHHSGSDNDTLDSIHKYHKTKFSSNGIVYHYAIDKNGYMYQMRHLTSVTSSVANRNTRTVSILLLGDYTNKSLSIDQMTAAHHIMEYLVKKLSLKYVLLHSQVTATLCPGVKYISSILSQSYLNELYNLGIRTKI